MSRTGLRERKKLQTRVDIIQATIDLVAEKGYDDTTVDDIVDRANYSRSTFFRYFGGKEDVLFADLPDRFVEVFGSLEPVEPGADALKVVRDIVIPAILEFASVAPDLEAACVALWFTEPTLHRRYLGMVLDAETVLTGYFAASWGVDADETPECAVLAAGVLGVARTVIQSQLSDRAAVRRALTRGFDLLEQGATRNAARLRRRSPAEISA